MLCVFIDAWNPEYLKNMPFLDSIRKDSLHGLLEVPFGYTGIIASFITGRFPDKHGIFDLFVPDSVRKFRITQPYINAAIRLFQDKKYFHTPLQVKEGKYFKPSLDKTWPQKNSLNIPTIYDILEKSKKSFEAIDWPNHFRNRKGRIFFSKDDAAALSLARKSKADFIFLHFLELDTLGHKFGTKSQKVREACRRIDAACKALWKKDENILFFSDHGMNDIEKEVDIISEIDKLDLRFGKDLIYLAGSTTVEFWFKNREARQKVTAMLKKLKYGKIVRQEDFRIKTDSLIFLADFKTAFHPNFFSKHRFKAMHGWDTRLQKTYYILKNRKLKGKKDAKMVDFLPTILKIMNLPSVQADGKSLV